MNEACSIWNYQHLGKYDSPMYVVHIYLSFVIKLINSPYLCLVTVMPAPQVIGFHKIMLGGGVRGMVRQLMGIIHEENTTSQMHVPILLVKFVRTAPSGILQNLVNAE